MGLVEKLRGDVRKARKVGLKERLLNQIMCNREEEREVEEFMLCMDLYADIAKNPFGYAFKHMVMAEDTLDDMIAAAVDEQRKHRQYAQEALEQETVGVQVNKCWAK